MVDGDERGRLNGSSYSFWRVVCENEFGDLIKERRDDFAQVITRLLEVCVVRT